MPTPFAVPRFNPILDTTVLADRGCSALIAAEGLIEGGARILQYRHKDVWTQAHFDDAKRICDACQQSGVRFVINDRADFALLLKCALHVGQDDLPPVAARRVITDEVMGFSTHSKLQLTRGNDEPVEYLSLGPIFATTSKLRPDPTVGVEEVRKLRALTKKPLVGIGGISMENAAQVLEAGANSVAVISKTLPERLDRASIRKRTEDWKRLLDSVRLAE